MKYNKGFAPIAIIAIVVGALVIVGGTYYLGKSSKTVPQNTGVNNYQPQENQNNQPVQNNSNEVPTGPYGNETNYVAPTPLKDTSKTSCKTGAEWIKVISPNGSEVYKAGDKITVKWENCNIATDSGINIGVGTLGFTTTNTGSYTFTIPSNFPGGNYKAKVELDTPTPTTILDYSDTSFRINNSVACFTSFPSLSLSLDSTSPTGNIKTGSNNIELARFGLTPSGNCNLKINQLTIVDGGPGLANNLKIYDGNSNLIATGVSDGYHQFSFYFSNPLVLTNSATKILIVKADIQKDLYGTTSTAERGVMLNLAIGDWKGTISGAIDQSSNMSLNNYNILAPADGNLSSVHSNKLIVTQ